MPSVAFNDWIKKLSAIEGGYVNVKTDLGGETNFGITRATAELARQRLPNIMAGWDGDMRHLTHDQAIAIYKAWYWDRVRADDIASWCKEIALEVADSAVNCGVVPASTWFQVALNCMNRQGMLYPDIAEDGAIGPTTISVAMNLQTKGDKQIVLKMLDSQQGAHYIDLMKRVPNQENNARGWFSKRIGNESII